MGSSAVEGILFGDQGEGLPVVERVRLEAEQARQKRGVARRALADLAGYERAVLALDGALGRGDAVAAARRDGA